jgi:Helix-turn-helix domain
MTTFLCHTLTLPNGKVVGLLNENDAAAYLAVAVQTLRNWRSLGQGPPFVHVGRRIGYRLSDLEGWVEKHVT